jgi:hypothetical protein
VAPAKLLTELTTLDAALLTAPICAAEELDASPLTALSNEATEDSIAVASPANSRLS